jgi:GrpB-like predicted nucleotidyltransferase (UPF0157 family)
MHAPPPHAVSIVPHDPAWAGMAAAEAARVAGAMEPLVLRTEHVGSTAVPGLAAKPVIDLMSVVASLEDLDWRRNAVEALGYLWHGEFGIAGRRFCTLTRHGECRFHLHFYEQGSPEVAPHLAFRDYLRAHPAAARAYAAEKRRAEALHPYDSFAYNQEKAAWVGAEVRRAEAWAGLRGTARA